MISFFSRNSGAGLPDGVWPKAKLLATLKRRYEAVEEIGEESGFLIYAVTDGDIRFAVVMATVDGAADRISEVGFLARFSGYNFSPAQLDSVNRNLHISIASYHSDGDLYLIGGVSAAGDYNEGTFLLILEAWKRDLLVILQATSLAQSLADAHPAVRLQAVRRLAPNRAGEEGAPRDLFAAYAGGRALSLCADCGGRGKTGFFAKVCGPCGGSGFVAAARRRGAVEQ